MIPKVFSLKNHLKMIIRCLLVLEKSNKTQSSKTTTTRSFIALTRKINNFLLTNMLSDTLKKKKQYLKIVCSPSYCILKVGGSLVQYSAPDLRGRGSGFESAACQHLAQLS